MRDLSKRNYQGRQSNLTQGRTVSKLEGSTKWTLRYKTNVMWIFVAFIFFLTTCRAHDEATSALCRNVRSESCADCIGQSRYCGWCADPAFPGEHRCDAASIFNSTCPPQYQYQDLSQAIVTENVAAGTYEPKYGKIRQIEPQQVHVLVKPGDTVTFPMKYYHPDKEEKDIYVLNSDTQPHGVTLTYSMNCKGSCEQGQLCGKVQNEETVQYNVSVSIRDCQSHAVVSIGIASVREVVALYIRPQCGCDCERPDRQERHSGHCGSRGTLSCGVCLCDQPDRGGKRCECELAPGTTSSQLESQCREAPGKAQCSGHGYCACGTCVCDPPQLYNGKYCECGNVECPTVNGVTCNGQGNCVCGKCQCHSGWTGSNCECSPDQNACSAENGDVCSGHGTCVCNKCTCDDGYEGEKCERSRQDPVVMPPSEPSEPEPHAPGPTEEESNAVSSANSDSPGETADADSSPPLPQPPDPEQSAEGPPAGSGCAWLHRKDIFGLAILGQMLNVALRL